jgi:hypothetical protein
MNSAGMVDKGSGFGLFGTRGDAKHRPPRL